MKKFYTTGDVARICGVGMGTVVKWCNRGRLKCYRIPDGAQHRRIQHRHLLAFLRERGLPLDELLGCEHVEQYGMLLLTQDALLRDRLHELLSASITGHLQAVSDLCSAGYQLATLQPQALIVDLGAGRWEGLLLAEFARQQKTLHGLFAVALANEDETQQQELRQVFDAVLGKPFDIVLLAELLAARTRR